MSLKRAYSVLEIKAVDDELRIIEGIATTPNPDRYQDIVETGGIEFKLPIPLLYQHDSKNPIGQVVEAKVAKDGMHIKAQIAAAGLDSDVDKAWGKIKNGLVRGLSIGFRSLEETWDKTINGFRFIRTEWLELSAVTIPANAEATITTVKSYAEEARAASGRERSTVVRLDPNPPAGVTAKTQGKNMTIKEQIAALEAKRQASQARMTELATKSADEGRTFDESEQEEFDTLQGDVKSIDDHLNRLRPLEKQMQETAKPVENVKDEKTGAQVRSGATVQVKANQPKGSAVTRAVIALAASKGLSHVAEELAQKHYPDNPEVSLLCRYMSDERYAIHDMMMKELVDPGTTTGSTWAAPLVPNAQQLIGEFLELLMPQTIIGRIPNLNRVPFNVAVPRQTGDGTYGWVGEGAAKPVGRMSYDSVTLRWAKAAGIVPLTKELVKFSSPSAEDAVRNQMVRGFGKFLDVQFIDHNVTAVANVSPAGITQGVTPVTPTGTTADAFRADMQNLFNNMTLAYEDPTDFVILMTASQALALSLLVNALGQAEFPTISVKGGSILGLPVIVSEAVGLTAAGSRSERIIVINPRNILIAEEGLMIDASDQASIEMNTHPTETSSPVEHVELVSAWQRNLLFIKVERFTIWTRGRESSVQFISGNNYGGATSP